MPADQHSTAPPDPTHESLRTDLTPLGERALREILDHVVALGDAVETSYLEVKSQLDLRSKIGVAKVAKFLLGAANRLPVEARRYFHGHAVLVIGAQKGEAPGVPRGIEPHELEDRLRPYLGSQLPAFEFGRVGVDAENEVVFVIAQPPLEGQPVFPCHKSYHGEDRRDSLEDGAIYVRGISNTRSARAGEIQALVERARGSSKPAIDLDIDILGSVGRVDHIDPVLERLYDYEEEEFVKRERIRRNSSGSALLAPIISTTGQPSRREERLERLDTWRSEKPGHIAKGREHFIGVGLPGVGIKVVSRDRFVAKPHLTLTFHDCEAFDYLEPEDADFEKVIEPIIRSRDPLGISFAHYTPRITTREYPVSWSNHDGNAQVVLTPESFRPNVPWTSDQDDYVILANDPLTASVSVTWMLTEDGSDEATRGELEVTTAELIDAPDLYDAAFSPKE